MMTITVPIWVIGLSISLILGQLLTWSFLKVLRFQMAIAEESPEVLRKRVPPWLTGAIERLFFTVLVGANVDGFPTAMIGWLALKLATNWNHKDVEKETNGRAFAFSALLAGIVSMLCSLVGGLFIAKYNASCG